jgi:hypothetical protein
MTTIGAGVAGSSGAGGGTVAGSVVAATSTLDSATDPGGT